MVTAPHEVQVKEVVIGAPEHGQLLVRVHYSCISPGTEMRVMGGGPPENAAFPYIPGYSAAGVVEQVGPGCTVKPGTKVFLTGTTSASIALSWGGHVEYAVAPESSLYLLPDGLGLAEASSAHLVAISRRGLVVSEASPGDKVVVIGLGPIGMLSARLFHEAGCEVHALDLDPYRVQLAQSSGVSAEAPSKALGDHVQHRFGRGADIVVDATGVAALMPQTMSCVKAKPWDGGTGFGGKVVVQGSYEGAVSIDYISAFRGEMRFYFPRDSTPSDIRASIDLMGRRRLSVSDMVRVVPVLEAPQTYQALLNREKGWMTAAFDWSA